MNSMEDYEDVVQVNSELGRYEASADVRLNFQNFEMPLNETINETSRGETATFDEAKYNPLSRASKYLLSLLKPSRSQVVAQLYEKYLWMFPNNAKIVENLTVLKTIENENRSMIGSFVRKFTWSDILSSQQPLEVVPLVVAGQVLIKVVHGAWKIQPCVKALQAAQSLVVEFRKCWNHMTDIYELHVESRHLTKSIKSMMVMLQKCLVMTCVEFEKEIELMPDALEKKTYLKDKTFNGRQMSYSDLINECASRGTLNFTLVQNLTEVVCEQIVDYSFRLSVLYCWSEHDETITYQPSELDTFATRVKDNLAFDFWDTWEAAVELDTEIKLAMIKKRAEIAEKYTPKPKLLRMTGIFQDSLTTTILLLQEIEGFVNSDQDLIRKTELKQLEIRLTKELAAIQRLGLMELELLRSLTSDFATSEACIIYHPDSFTANENSGSNHIDESAGYLASQETSSTFTFQAAGVDSPHDSASDLQQEDEVFELVSTEEDQTPGDPTQESDGVDKCTMLAMRTVLVALYEQLKERREAAKIREREAYFRKNGKYPDEEPDESPLLRNGRSDISDTQVEKSDLKESFNSSDEDDAVEIEPGVRLPSMVSLANFLEKKLSQAPMTAHGIVPIQREDSNEPSPTTSQAEDEDG